MQRREEMAPPGCSRDVVADGARTIARNTSLSFRQMLLVALGLFERAVSRNVSVRRTKFSPTYRQASRMTVAQRNNGNRLLGCSERGRRHGNERLIIMAKKKRTAAKVAKPRRKPNFTRRNNFFRMMKEKELKESLAAALRRAEAAHAEHEKRIGHPDADWPDWYAEYIVREQAGEPPPR